MIRFSILVGLIIWMAACTAPYDEEIPNYTPQIVIEASINTTIPLLNYAVVSKSLDYFNPDLNLTSVSNAKVYVTLGVLENDIMTWPETNKVEFMGNDSIPGLYLAPLFSFIPMENNYYKMEVVVEGETYTSINYMPLITAIDTYYVENIFNQKADSNQPFLRLSFTDPPAFGDNYILYSYTSSQPFPLLWGAAERLIVLDDEYINGQSFKLNAIFPDNYGDTVHMYLCKIDGKAFDYWESYENSINNGGPFAQPINVQSTFDKGIGVFTAMAISTQSLIIVKP